MDNLYKPVRFFNFTDEDFSWTWDKQLYTFPAKKAIYMEMWKAQHFAKHLVNRVLNTLDDERVKNGLRPFTTSHQSRPDLIAKCVILDGKEDMELKDIEQVNTTILNLNQGESEKGVKHWCESCDSKGVRHKKDCPSLAPSIA